MSKEKKEGLMQKKIALDQETLQQRLYLTLGDGEGLGKMVQVILRCHPTERREQILSEITDHISDMVKENFTNDPTKQDEKVRAYKRILSAKESYLYERLFKKYSNHVSQELIQSIKNGSYESFLSKGKVILKHEELANVVNENIRINSLKAKPLLHGIVKYLDKESKDKLGYQKAREILTNLDHTRKYTTDNKVHMRRQLLQISTDTTPERVPELTTVSTEVDALSLADPYADIDILYSKLCSNVLRSCLDEKDFYTAEKLVLGITEYQKEITVLRYLTPENVFWVIQDSESCPEYGKTTPEVHIFGDLGFSAERNPQTNRKRLYYTLELAKAYTNDSRMERFSEFLNYVKEQINTSPFEEPEMYKFILSFSQKV